MLVEDGRSILVGRHCEDAQFEGHRLVAYTDGFKGGLPQRLKIPRYKGLKAQRP